MSVNYQGNDIEITTTKSRTTGGTSNLKATSKSFGIGGLTDCRSIDSIGSNKFNNIGESGGYTKMMSQSYGGGPSQFLSKMMSEAPPPGSIQRFSSVGTGTAGISYSGYLYKRSNYPHHRPVASSSSHHSDHGDDAHFPLHHTMTSPLKHPYDSSTTDSSTFYIDPMDVPDLPSMPGMFATSSLHYDQRHNLHEVQYHNNMLSDRQRLDCNSPLATTDTQNHSTSQIAATAIVTPSPVNNITASVDTAAKQVHTQSSSSFAEHQGEQPKEEMHTFQFWENAASFFGLRLGGDEKEQKQSDATKLAKTSSPVAPVGQSQQSNATPEPPILTSNLQPKSTTSPIQMIQSSTSSSASVVEPTARRAIPIPTSNQQGPHPTIAHRKQSFLESNHRRHSAPIKMTPPRSDASHSELLESSLSFGPNNNSSHSIHKNGETTATLFAAGGIPQDFYDPKDGHLWRAKYCVLEDGVLYFYRNANDGDSVEAAAERKRTHEEEYQLGINSSSSPGRNTIEPPKVSIPPCSSALSLSRRRSSAKELSQSPMIRPVVHHLDTSDGHGSDSMWEKRVFLDCIEEVRTAEQQFGKNSFELTAVSDEDNQVDKLVLRAPNGTEMNEWIFQFHRSLASFMRNIMDVFGSASTTGAFLDIQRPPSMLTPSHTKATSHHTPVRMAGSLPHSPSEKQLQRLIATTPCFQNQIVGLAGTSTQLSLSHGHGRTSFRRRVDLKRTSSEGVSLSSTPETHDTDSPQHQFAFREPSPICNLLGSPEAINPPSQFLIPPPPSGSASTAGPRSSLLSLENRHRVATPPLPPESHEKNSSGHSSVVPVIERPIPSIGKYIPPHLRPNHVDFPSNRQESSATKYVPPHMRNRLNETSGATTPTHPAILSLAERAQLAPSTPVQFGFPVGATMPSEDPLDVVEYSVTEFIRGGCADPKLIQGSILDQAYIPKRAGRVKKVSAEVFGSFGGGEVNADGTDFVRGQWQSPLRWEMGAISECGVRPYNEDAFLISNDVLSSFRSGSFDHFIEQTYWTKDKATHSPGLFAIFDGHVGNQMARFAVERFGHYVQEILSRESSNDSNETMSPANVEAVLREAMLKLDTDFCTLCQEGGREWESGATALIAMIVNENLVIGNLGDCRGVLCRSVNRPYHCSSGWLELKDWDDDVIGLERNPKPTNDSRTCFYREVTNTHTPAVEEEKSRIEEANGWITTDQDIPIAQLRRMDFLDEDVIAILKRCLRYSDGKSEGTITNSDSERSTKECKTAPHRILHISRVCGELAVSRALGDRDFKAAFNSLSTSEFESNQSFPDAADGAWWDSPLFLTYPENHNHRFQGDLVSNTPDIQCFRVGEDGVTDEFLLLACDGLWDVLDTDDAVRVVRDLLFQKKWTAKRAAARLAELAIHLGSSDNVTVIVVRLFSLKDNL